MKKWLDDDKSRRKLGAGTALFVIAVGILLLLAAGIRFVTEERGIGLVEPGVALIAAGVASFVAVVGVTAWAEQRDQDRQRAEYRNREESYDAIAKIMLSRFPDESGSVYDRQKDRELRTTAALWASNDVVIKLGAWQRQITTVMTNHGVTSGTISPTDEEQKAVKSCFGAALASMRVDLASETTEGLSKDEILASIFND